MKDKEQKENSIKESVQEQYPININRIRKEYGLEPIEGGEKNFISLQKQHKHKRTLDNFKKLNNFMLMKFLSDYTYDESIRIYHTLEDFIKNIESEKSVLSEVNESDIEKFLNNKLIREKVILFDLIKKCNECNIETQYAVGEVSMIMSLMIQSNLFKSDSNNKI